MSIDNKIKQIFNYWFLSVSQDFSPKIQTIYALQDPHAPDNRDIRITDGRVITEVQLYLLV